MSADQLEEPFMPFNLAAAPAVKPTAHKLFLPLPANDPRRSPPAARISLSAAELPAMSLGSHQESISAAERCISYSKWLKPAQQLRCSNYRPMHTGLGVVSNQAQRLKIA